MYRYVFVHKPTGQQMEAFSYAIIQAQADITARNGVKADDLSRHECWEGRHRIWHYDEKGDIQSG